MVAAERRQVDERVKRIIELKNKVICFVLCAQSLFLPYAALLWVNCPHVSLHAGLCWR